MKKLALAILFVLAMGFGAFAQSGSGMFEMGAPETTGNQGDPASFDLALPSHGQTSDQSAPLGGGALLLIGFGAAYAAARRRKE